MDRTGQFQVDADFVGFDDGKVQLKRADDGSVISVPLSILSDRDQRWVHEELKRRRDKPTLVASTNTDWPGWRGPLRDGISRETGLLKRWPDGGPELLWSSSGLGRGYSSVTVVGDRLFTMGKMNGRVMLICADREDGSVLWETAIGGGGDPNCSPTVDLESNLIFGLSNDGDLACAEIDSGSIVWSKNFVNDFGGRMMSQWGYSESPLVDGDRLICTPGGDRAVLVALEKGTGNVIWSTAMPEGSAGYASPVISNAGGVKQYITLIGNGLIGVRADNGELLWHYPKIANGTANVPTPIVDGDFVFCSSGYDDGGSALLQLQRKGRAVVFREVYYKNNQELQNHHGGMILIDGRVYMGHGHNQGFPRCVDLRSGRTLWGEGQRGPGKGSAAIVAADGHLVFRYEDGVVALIEASPSGYNLKGQFRAASVDGKAWAHPVIAGKKLFLRDQDTLHCYDIGE